MGFIFRKTSQQEAVGFVRFMGNAKRLEVFLCPSRVSNKELKSLLVQRINQSFVINPGRFNPYRDVLCFMLSLLR